MTNNARFGIILLAVIAAVVYMSTFIVHERELAIKFRLGEIVESNYSPGIYLQIPIINNVLKFDSRVLTMDTPSERFLTAEKKNVIVNSFAKWRIVDPKTFYTSTGGDQRQAIAQATPPLTSPGRERSMVRASSATGASPTTMIASAAGPASPNCSSEAAP